MKTIGRVLTLGLVWYTGFLYGGNYAVRKKVNDFCYRVKAASVGVFHDLMKSKSQKW